MRHTLIDLVQAGLIQLDTDWFATSSKELTDLGKLKDDWDGYGATAPNYASISTAKAILELMRDVELKPDRITSIPEGGVAIYFSRPGGFAGLECHNSTDLVAFNKSPEEPIATWRVSLSEPDIRQSIDEIKAVLGR